MLYRLMLPIVGENEGELCQICATAAGCSPGNKLARIAVARRALR
jgi:hypothetical protein